jgi:aromatic ring hydroxylase
MSRRIYIETPANCYQNHHSNIRFWSKLGLIVGVASRICEANGIDKIPAVRETLGRLATLEATIGSWCRARSRHGRMATRLRHAEPAHHVCGSQLVSGAPFRDRRHAARS